MRRKPKSSNAATPASSAARRHPKKNPERNSVALVAARLGRGFVLTAAFALAAPLGLAILGIVLGRIARLFVIA